MIKPVNFQYNKQTAKSNFFAVNHKLSEDIQKRALKEFDNFSAVLRRNGIDVILTEALKVPVSPDAIFPNNWITTHEDGTVFLYPMLAESRRKERRLDIINLLKNDFYIEAVIDLTGYEREEKFLEGTGSMVLDRKNKLAYACLSPRTNFEVLDDFCTKVNYTPVAFNALDEKERSIYHTNVMMSINANYAVICLEAIKDIKERRLIRKRIEETNKEIIEINLSQMRQFAGNTLELCSQAGRTLAIMSEQAYRSYKPEQLDIIERHASIVSAPLNTIEHVGGGSARCMIAEIFLPRLQQ